MVRRLLSNHIFLVVANWLFKAKHCFDKFLCQLLSIETIYVFWQQQMEFVKIIGEDQNPLRPAFLLVNWSTSALLQISTLGGGLVGATTSSWWYCSWRDVMTSCRLSITDVFDWLWLWLFLLCNEIVAACSKYCDQVQSFARSSAASRYFREKDIVIAVFIGICIIIALIKTTNVRAYKLSRKSAL